MNNQGTATAYSIRDRKEFRMGVISLMKKIQGKIDSIASRVKIQDARPSRKVITNLSVLKIHEYKLKEILEWIERIDKQNG